MNNQVQALKALEKMDLKELRRVYRVSFKIKTLEPWRATVAQILQSRGAKLPRITGSVSK